MNGTIMMCSSESTAQSSATVRTSYVTNTKYGHVNEISPCLKWQVLWLYHYQDFYKLQKLSAFYSNHYLIELFHFTVSQFQYDREGKEPEDRDVMQDVQTQFVPPAASHNMIRHKRSTAPTLETYQVSSKQWGY